MQQLFEPDPSMRHLERLDRPWRAMPEEARAAILELLAEPYQRLAYPTEADFAAAFGVETGSAEYAREWARQLAERKANQRAAYNDEDWVYALFTRDRAGGLIGLATMLTVHGARDATLAEAIGDPASSLPTLRMLRFGCDERSGLRPGATRERDLAEFARICIRQPAELATLVAAGALSGAEAAYVERHGFDECFALSYWRDRARPNPPRAYLGNAQPRMSGALARRGVDVRPLHLVAGAEPTERILGGARNTRAYFGRWPEVLRPYVPAAVLARGTAAAIAHLVAQGFTGWEQLELSLPFLILDNAKTAEAMATLAHACGLSIDRFDALSDEDWRDTRDPIGPV